MTDNEALHDPRRDHVIAETLRTGRVELIDVGRYAERLITAATKDDRGFVIELGGEPLAYLAPYNGAYITFTVPSGEAGE